MADSPPVEDQARLLEDALSMVRQQTVMMRKCLESPGKLMDALKCGYVDCVDCFYHGRGRELDLKILITA